MTERPGILIIAAPTDREPVVAALAGVHAEIAATPVTSLAELTAALATPPRAVVFVTGISGLDFDAVQACWRTRGHALPCIVVDREHSDERMAAFMRAGATDYVCADRLARLPLALDRELARARDVEAAPVSGDASLMQAIVDGLPYMLFVKDAEELRTRVMNDLGLKMVGATREQMIGKLDHE